jgi:pimeloyl-ACP methyl ester carboxylesterase
MEPGRVGLRRVGRKAPRALLLLCAALAALSAPGSSAAANIAPVGGNDAGAATLAEALAADPGTVAEARFLSNPPFGTPNAVSDNLSFFPTDGPTFAILSTGRATIADDPNFGGASGTDDGGPSVRGNTDFDVTVLAVDLNVPAGRNCVAFDFAFYSEEFPEWVGTAFNDAFIAELDVTTWSTSGSTISAPDNFAFDVEGNPVSINSTGVTGMNELNASNTTYDGATILLQAAHAITPGAHTVYFSIFDQGDHIYDSAVFIDNLRLLTVDPSQCQPGAREGTLPLLVLPGITGSFLRNPDGEAWPRAVDVLTSPSDDFFDNLRLADNGVDPLDPDDPSYDISVWRDHGRQGVIDSIDIGCVFGNCLHRIQPYAPLFEHLEEEGYEENVSLFPFAFDWRKSAEHNADELIAKIEDVLEATGAPRVDILAHSQGGLVTEAALTDARSVGKVARVMTVGTPYLGATKALGALDYGEPCQTEVLSLCILNREQVQEIVTNFPGFLDLLPSRPFYGQAYVSSVITLFDRDGDGAVDGFVDFDTQRDKLADRNLALIDQSRAFHDRVDNWSPADPGVELTRLVGSGLPTIRMIIEYLEEECSGILWWHECHLVEKSQFFYDNGDGTVPLHSADLFDPEHGFDFRGGAPNAYAPGVEHGELVQAEHALDFITSYLAGAQGAQAAQVAVAATATEEGGPTGPTPELAAEAEAEHAARGESAPAAATAALAEVAALGEITEEPSLLAGTELLVKGPVYGLLVDGDGNRLGTPEATSDVALLEVPGAAFNLADGNASSFVTLDGLYRGSWTATADGWAQLVVRTYTDDVIDGSASTPPIQVRPGAVLSLSLSRPTALSLLGVDVDDDGDGTVDRTILFGEPLGSDAAADVMPPVSRVSIENVVDAATQTRLARVRISATDEGGSGVDRIEYAFDATDTGGVYADTLTVPADGHVIVRAIDRAGNIEAPYQVVRLAVDAEPNELGDVTALAVPHVNGPGYLDYAGDLDWWGFELPAAGRYQFQLIGLPADYDLELFGADGTQLATSARRGTESERIAMELPAGGAYVRIRGHDGAFDVHEPYRINVTPLG